MISRSYLAGLMVTLMIVSYTVLFIAECTLYPVIPDRPDIVVNIIDEVHTINTYSRSEEEVPLRYGFTDDEVYLLTQLLCGDESIDGDGEYDFVWHVQNGGNYYEEMAKVLSVVMNRQRSEDFPNTVTDVVLQDGQFSPMPENTSTHPSEIALEEVRKWCNLYDLYDEMAQVAPEDHLFFSAGSNLTNITRKDW